MERLPLINPDKQPDLAFQALMDGFIRLCSHQPLLVGHQALIADTEPNFSALMPAPEAVVRSGGFIAFRATETFPQLSQRGWKVTAGDILIVELHVGYDVGDTILFAHVGEELGLASLRADGTLYSLMAEGDEGGINREECMVIGPVAELRRLSSAGRRVLAQKEASRDPF